MSSVETKDRAGTVMFRRDGAVTRMHSYRHRLALIIPK